MTTPITSYITVPFKDRFFSFVATTDAPVCEEVDAAAQVYAAGVGQTINITCGVLASPTVVKFSWVFNNSIKSERLPGNQVFLKSGKRVCKREEGSV